MNNLPERLYHLRIESGGYQKELAHYLHVSVGTISNYENGYTVQIWIPYARSPSTTV